MTARANGDCDKYSPSLADEQFLKAAAPRKRLLRFGTEVTLVAFCTFFSSALCFISAFELTTSEQRIYCAIFAVVCSSFFAVWRYPRGSTVTSLQNKLFAGIPFRSIHAVGVLNVPQFALRPTGYVVTHSSYAVAIKHSADPRPFGGYELILGHFGIDFKAAYTFAQRMAQILEKNHTSSPSSATSMRNQESKQLVDNWNSPCQIDWH